MREDDEKCGSERINEGLSESVALQRLKAEGFNELPQSRRRSALQVIIEVLSEPMLALLLASGIIYLVLGDLTEAVVLMAFATMSIFITVIQQTRSERALAALRDLSSPRALVIRDGIRRRIAGREVVRGDVLVLSEGDRVPADGFLFNAYNLQVDESLLTGERIAAGKDANTTGNREISEAADFTVKAGTLIVRGSGIAEASAIGIATEMLRDGLASTKLLGAEQLQNVGDLRRLDRTESHSTGVVHPFFFSN